MLPSWNDSKSGKGTGALHTILKFESIQITGVEQGIQSSVSVR